MDGGIFLGLGSNMGDRRASLDAAVKHVQDKGMRIHRTSSIYETPPWGNTDQPPFLNMVVEIGFPGEPEDLLATVIHVEEALGRIRTTHWGPRIIDMDILAFGERIVRSQRLSIPHPLLAERAFVLVPWAEIAPDFRVAGLDATVQELLERLPAAERRGIHMHLS